MTKNEIWLKSLRNHECSLKVDRGYLSVVDAEGFVLRKWSLIDVVYCLWHSAEEVGTDMATMIMNTSNYLAAENHE